MPGNEKSHRVESKETSPYIFTIRSLPKLRGQALNTVVEEAQKLGELGVPAGRAHLEWLEKHPDVVRRTFKSSRVYFFLGDHTLGNKEALHIHPFGPGSGSIAFLTHSHGLNNGWRRADCVVLVRDRK